MQAVGVCGSDVHLCQGLISSYLLLFFLPPIVACSTTTGKTLGVQLLT
jgi:hypothetical protein